MTNYYLHLVILQNCPYSIAAKELLENHPHIKTIITSVNNTNKENYKTDEIDTFPQIYLKKKNKQGSLLIGGYTEFKKLFDQYYKMKDYNNNKITQINNKWSKRALLNFIILINSNV